MPLYFGFLHLWVVVCWICLEDDATSTDALEDGWVGGVGLGTGLFAFCTLSKIMRTSFKKIVCFLS